MPVSEKRAAPHPRTVDLALAIGVCAALFAAMLPLLRVVDSGTWVGAAFGLTVAVLATGFVARWFRLPGILVSLAELLVGIVLVTLAFGRGTALLWVLPTPDTFALADGLARSAIEDVRLGAAPLEASTALSFLIVASMGLLAVALDHVVLTARMPLLAAVGFIAVSVLPSIAVPGEVDVFAFVLLAASILFLLAVDTRARQRAATARSDPASARLEPRRVAPGAAIGIGAVAVVVALIASPLLPAPLTRAGGTGGDIGSATIEPSLELGDDLRQPGEVEVLRVHTTESAAPYLRIATLSEFTGVVWEPDLGDAFALADDGPGIAAETVDEGIAVAEYRTTVDVVNLDSRWAPVPYPATVVTGLAGDWSMFTENRTVHADVGSVRGQSWETVTAVPEPTLEQIRARSAVGGGDRALPRPLPSVIEQTAREVTADARTDYDALVALQAWFRGSSFVYSLEAPVSEGFDGTGMQAIADFLEVKEGYCVHFASAFAVMARTLGMSARIVVGYLPGTRTADEVDGRDVFSVRSTQLHAWPEVRFEGVGWVPFEPTNSLGTPASYASDNSLTPGSVPSSNPESAAPTATPAPTLSSGPTPLDDPDGPAASGGGSTASVNPWPFALGFAVLLLLVAPGVARDVRRRRLLAAARRGDATAAWLSIQELAIDLGIPAPAAESPRAFGRRLVGCRGADPAAMDVLVAAIERASYAGGPTPVLGDAWADAVDAASTSLLRAASPRGRFAARALPRSLAIRPGSARASRRVGPARESPA